MPCRGCGGRSSLNGHRSVMSQMRDYGRPAVQNNPGQINERDFVKVKYLHPNRGSHGVVGSHAFANKIEGLQMRNRGDGWIIDYGYRSGGTVFTVHRLDAESQPHIFQIIEETPKAVMHSGVISPRPSVPIVPPPIIREGRIKSFDLQTLPGMTHEIASQLEADGITSKEKIIELGVDGIQKYKGVGAKKGKMIIEAIQAMQ